MQHLWTNDFLCEMKGKVQSTTKVKLHEAMHGEEMAWTCDANGSTSEEMRSKGY